MEHLLTSSIVFKRFYENKTLLVHAFVFKVKINCVCPVIKYFDLEMPTGHFNGLEEKLQDANIDPSFWFPGSGVFLKQQRRIRNKTKS